MDIERPRRMVLNPLTEVVIGVFMTVGVGGGQFVMDVLGNCKRRKGQQQYDKSDGEAGLDSIDKIPSIHLIAVEVPQLKESCQTDAMRDRTFSLLFK
jgi:hypothetical protein